MTAPSAATRYAVHRLSLHDPRSASEARAPIGKRSSKVRTRRMIDNKLPLNGKASVDRRQPTTDQSTTQVNDNDTHRMTGGAA